MIQEKRCIFCDVIIVGVNVGEREGSSYEHMSDSEFLPRQRCLILPRNALSLTPLHFCLRGWKKSEVYK